MSAACTWSRIEHLLRRYGSCIDDLLAELRERPELSRPLPGADDYLAVEVRYAATHEGALHLDDVLTRRTRISIETWDRGLEAAAPGSPADGARCSAGTSRQVAREVDVYRARVRAERRLAGAGRRPRGGPGPHRRARCESSWTRPDVRRITRRAGPAGMRRTSGRVH